MLSLSKLRALGILYLRNGWTYQRILSGLQKTQYYSPQELAAYQNRKLQDMVRHCYRHVPYYRSTFQALRLKPEDIRSKTDLKKLPFIDKHVVQARFDEFISRKGIEDFAF